MPGSVYEGRKEEPGPCSGFALAKHQLLVMKVAAFFILIDSLLSFLCLRQGLSTYSGYARAQRDPLPSKSWA